MNYEYEIEPNSKGGYTLTTTGTEWSNTPGYYKQINKTFNQYASDEEILSFIIREKFHSKVIDKARDIGIYLGVSIATRSIGEFIFKGDTTRESLIVGLLIGGLVMGGSALLKNWIETKKDQATLKVWEFNKKFPDTSISFSPRDYLSTFHFSEVSIKLPFFHR